MNFGLVKNVTYKLFIYKYIKTGFGLKLQGLKYGSIY